MAETTLRRADLEKRGQRTPLCTSGRTTADLSFGLVEAGTLLFLKRKRKGYLQGQHMTTKIPPEIKSRCSGVCVVQLVCTCGADVRVCGADVRVCGADVRVCGAACVGVRC